MHVFVCRLVQPDAALWQSHAIVLAYEFGFVVGPDIVAPEDVESQLHRLGDDIEPEERAPYIHVVRKLECYDC